MEQIKLNSPFQRVLSIFFTALVSAAFAISFATIIYRGDLAVFLDKGIGLTLLATVVISLVGAVALSFKGSILGPQDVPAILLSSGAAGIIAQYTIPPEALFATVACLVAVTSVVTGILGLAIGKLRLAHVTRFFPYPVLAGFLATTGLLLFRGGLELTLGGDYTGQLSEFFSQQNMERWMITLIVAIFICVGTRKISGSFVLPVALLLSLAGLYVFYGVLGYDLATLGADGLLLGPFQKGGFYTTIEPAMVLQADWSIILASTPLILTVALSALIGTTLNASGLELELKRDLDMNKEAHGSGLANVLSGLVGGIPGYHVVGETILASRLGLHGALAGISAAVGCGLLFLFGGALLNMLPLAFFGAVIAFLGLDLLYSWLWVERKRLGRADYAIVLLIPLTAVTFGFLYAIALGLLLCSAIFIVQYSRLNIIRTQRDLAMCHSRVERPASERTVLEKARDSAKVLELSNFIFFGTSQALRTKVQDMLATDKDIRWLVLDFTKVTGLDVSAQHILERIQESCDLAGVELILSGIEQDQIGGAGLKLMPSLDACITKIEETILFEAAPADGSGAKTDLSRFLASAALKGLTTTVTFQSGDTVIEETSQSRDIYLLQKGRLNAVTAVSAGNNVLLATILPGAVVGEMAYYTESKRSAGIIAEVASELVCLSQAQIDALENSDPKLAAQFHRLVARDLALRLKRSNGQLLALEG